MYRDDFNASLVGEQKIVLINKEWFTAALAFEAAVPNTVNVGPKPV